MAYATHGEWTRASAKLLTLCFLLVVGFTMAANAGIYSVGPKSHYLRAKASDTVTAPTIIDLTADGFPSGTSIDIEQLGGVVGVGGGADDQTSMSAVQAAPEARVAACPR